MELYKAIRNAIISGQFEQGKRLTEEALAEEFNVSRTPIREALKRLETEGLVTPLKRGVIVREYSKKDIVQIYRLRALLESYAAAEAALHRTEEDIVSLKETNEQYKKAVFSKDVHAIFSANARFHDAILTATDNEHLRFHLSKVVVLPLVFRSFYWYSEYQLHRSYEFHKTILHAIMNRHSDRAKYAMYEHIYLSLDHVLLHIDDVTKGGTKTK